MAAGVACHGSRHVDARHTAKQHTAACCAASHDTCTCLLQCLRKQQQGAFSSRFNVVRCARPPPVAPCLAIRGHPRSHLS
jgi:hypothetical protein